MSFCKRGHERVDGKPCVTCKRASQAASKRRARAKDPESNRAYQNAYREANREKVNFSKRVGTRLSRAATKICARGHAYAPGSGCLECAREKDRERRAGDEYAAMERKRAKRRWSDENRRKRRNERSASRHAARAAEDAEYVERIRKASRESARRARSDASKLSAMRARDRNRAPSRRADPGYRETMLESGRKYRANKRGATVARMNVRDWLRICDSFRNEDGEVACAYCRMPCKPTADHVVPLSRGGAHAPDNIVPACQSCNSSKGSKLLSEWRRILPAKVPPLERVGCADVR